MANISYYRVSTNDQSVEAQEHQLNKLFPVGFDKTFTDVGSSGATLASSRTGFKALLDYIREGDSLYVYALDRLGRDAIDVQQTVKALLDKGVTLHVNGLGVVAAGAGQIIVAEPPRELRRLQRLRRWSHDKVKQVLTRGPRACRAHGAGAPSRLPLSVGSH